MEEPKIPWTPYHLATHLVVGYSPHGDGGVLATAKDEFTARRYAKMLRPKYPDAHPVTNTAENLGKVHDAVRAILEAK